MGKESVMNKSNDIVEQLEKFSSECSSVMETECKKMSSSIESRRPIEPSGLNYLEIFKIQGKEKTYTNFLGWLLNPNSDHNLGAKPLYYFLKKIVSTNFKFNLEKVKVETEKSLEKRVPDLTIEGNNFICFIEIKIRAMEGRDQTRDIFKNGDKRAKKAKKTPFFIYLRLKGQKEADCKEEFKNVEWSEVIGSVLYPFYKKAEKPIKEILQVMIYNLQSNENEKLIKFFENEDKYKKDKVQYYIKLKQIKQLIKEKEGPWQC